MQPDARHDHEVVSDSVPGNWVDRHAPGWTLPYLRLSRADRPIGTWLLLIPCWWGVLLAANSSGNPHVFGIWIALACAVGAFLMRGAGCTWNDITDRKLDARVERTRSRPLPSGQLTVRNAYLWMIIQSLVAFSILLTFNMFTVWLGVASLATVAIYPFAKRFTWWPQIFLGIAFNWGAMLGWSAYSGSLGIAPLLLYLSGISWTLYYDTIYAHQDSEDDALVGIRSTARLFGERSRRWLIVFATTSVVLMALAMETAMPQPVSLGKVALCLTALFTFALHMCWQLVRLDIDDPESCLSVFRSMRNTGLLPALFLTLALLF